MEWLCAVCAWSLKIKFIPSSQLFAEVIWFWGVLILWAVLCPEPCICNGLIKQVCITSARL